MPKRKSTAGDEYDMQTEAGTKSKKAKTSKTDGKATYSSKEKRAIEEFAQVTQGDKNTAAKLLKQANWSMSAAVNAFYNNPSSTANPARKSLSRVFDPYQTNAKESPDELDIEGTGKLLEDLQIGLEDIGSLVFFELVQSPQIGVVTREGFVDGFADASCDSIPKIRNYSLARRSELTSDRALFKRVHDHTFSLLLEDRKKSIDLDQAEAFWRVLYSPAGFEWSSDATPWLDWYMEFLPTKVKVVNKDLWKQTLAFAEASKQDPSLSFWNEEASWPSVIDDFVAWVKSEKKPAGGDDMDVE